MKKQIHDEIIISPTKWSLYLLAVEKTFKENKNTYTYV